ncbi:MAG: hypothetical protein H0U27_06770, partial [Nitrosopumilus sp.]|nr:hypothetical protein [Nitrosopumilus sp.]
MEAPSNINDSFFDGVYKKVWKKMMPVALTGVEIEFIIEICDLKEMDKVLDLMCGHGRHAIGLAEKGYQVKAVDNQPEYIE